MQKKSATTGTSAVSRVKSIAGRSLLDEALPMTEIDEGRKGMYLDRPLALLPDGSEPIDHDDIPQYIREAIIADYGEDYFLGRRWNRGTIRKLEQVISRPRENLTHVVAMVCSGEDRCPFTDQCPYSIIGRIPIGDRCVLETTRARKLFESNLVALSDRLNVSTDDLRTDVIYSNMVWELVECELVKTRVMSSLAKKGELGTTVLAIWQETGEIHEGEVESPLIRIYEKYSARQDKIRQQLIATPEMAAKFKNKKANQDLHDRQLELLEKFEKVISSVKVSGAVDAEVIETK